jgi:tetratricopeptide (TPR) repeat protein
MDQRQEALATLHMAIEAQSGYFRPYQVLGAFYLDFAQYEQAVEQFRRVVALIPEWPESHLSLAIAYIKSGTYAEAEKEARISLGLDHNYVDALVTLGAALTYEGHDVESIACNKRVLEINPNSFLPWMNIGDAYRRSHQAAGAKQAYRKALELTRREVLRNPQNAYDRACTAYLLARLGENRQAEYEIAQSLALPATDEHARRMAVRTYEALGRRERTLSVLTDAPPALISDLSRSPDLADLRRDPRFIELLTNRKTL